MAISKGGMNMGKPLTAVSNSTQKGGLHKSLGVPMGQKIPPAMIAAAADKPGKIGKQARLAETYAKYRPTGSKSKAAPKKSGGSSMKGKK